MFSWLEELLVWHSYAIVRPQFLNCVSGPGLVFLGLSTAGFILKVLGVFTHPMETIYLYLRAQVAVGTADIPCIRILL